MGQDWVNSKQACSKLNISYRTLTRWIGEGKVESKKLSDNRLLILVSNNGHGQYEIDKDIDKDKDTDKDKDIDKQECFSFLEDKQGQQLLVEQLKSEIAGLKSQRDLAAKQVLERSEMISQVFMGSVI